MACVGDWIASFGSRAVGDLFVDENVDGPELMQLSEKGLERMLRPLVDKEKMPAVVNLLSERRDELLPNDIKEKLIAVTVPPVETQDERLPMCKVCLDNFNHTDRSPHVLSACGHSLCKACILQMRRTVQREKIRMRVVECPLCRKETSKDIWKNFELLDLIPMS